MKNMGTFDFTFSSNYIIFCMIFFLSSPVLPLQCLLSPLPFLLFFFFFSYAILLCSFFFASACFFLPLPFFSCSPLPFFCSLLSHVFPEHMKNTSTNSGKAFFFFADAPFLSPCGFDCCSSVRFKIHMGKPLVLPCVLELSTVAHCRKNMWEGNVSEKLLVLPPTRGPHLTRSRDKCGSQALV